MDTAFEILMEQHRPMLLTYAVALCYGDSEGAEDVVQETCLTAYLQLATFRRGENFARWLRGIARNKVLEHHRAANRRRCVTDSRILEGIEDVYGLLDARLAGEETWPERTRRWLELCMAQLSEHLRSAVERVYRQQMSLQQAADAEQTTFAAMAQRVSRSRELLRQCIQSKREQEG